MAIVVTYQLSSIELLTRSQVIDAMKIALRRLGEFWFDAFAAKRFTAEGAIEYGFRTRTAKYERDKARHWPENAWLPLVCSGEGREETLSDDTKRRIRVTRESVTIPLPRKFNRSHPHGPNMSEEIRAVSDNEIQILQSTLVGFINDELDKQLPPAMRRRGEVGGRVESLQLKVFNRPRSTRSPNPLRRRMAA